jgi:peroxiredoxin
VPVRAGDVAPDFELIGEYDRESGAFRTYRLSETLPDAPVVLQFFPAPFTRVCEFQMCSVRDNIDAYRGEGVAVWGVTAFPPTIIAAWSREHRFGVPVLADYDRSVSEAYVGVYSPETHPALALTTRRAVVSVGQDGLVRYVWIADESDIAPSDEVVREAILAAVRRRSGGLDLPGLPVADELGGLHHQGGAAGHRQEAADAGGAERG